MNKNRHIFYNIVKDENSMTELLSNFLQYKEFRDAFLQRMLSDEDNEYINNIGPENIYTQIRLGNDYGQPDLLIQNDYVDILFEIKVQNTGLTDNQPGNYLKYIENQDSDKLKRLIFLMPENYASIYRIKEQQGRLEIHYWKEIIEIIESTELHILSPLFNEFHKILKSWFELSEYHFTIKQIEFMYSKEMPELLLKLFDIIDNVSQGIKSNYIISKTKTSEEHGLYIKTPEGNEILFFGLWYDCWKKYGFPFCIAIYPCRTEKDIEDKFRQFYNNAQIEKYEDWVVKFIEKQKFDDNKIVKEIVKELENLLNSISPIN